MLDLQGRDQNDVIVTFEVLSPSTRDRDLRWKRNAYLSLPSLMHYVVIAQDAVDAVVFDGKSDALGRHFNRLDQSLDLPSVGVSLPLAEIYRDTALKNT
jgi:Uma2 family endonuclease